MAFRGRPGGAPEPPDPAYEPETGRWDMTADDGDGEGTATWDGPMAWQEDGRAGHWEQGRTWDEGAGPAWEGDGAATTAGVWDEGQGWAEPYGYEPGYQGGYAPTQYAQTGYSQTAYGRHRQEAASAYAEYGDTTAAAPWATDGDGRSGSHRRRRRGNGPWPELVMITAVAVIVAAVILAVTSADRTNLTNAQGQSSSTLVPSTPGSTAAHGPTSAPARPSPTNPPTTSAPKKTKSTTPSTQKAQNLLVTAGVEGSLIRSWLATNPGGAGLGAADVSGTEPGQVYYADQPATGTYWALVAFKPSAVLLQESSTAAGQEKLAQFQSSVYAFSWKQGPVWTLLGEVSTGSCPNVVPTPVLSVWGMCGL